MTQLSIDSHKKVGGASFYKALRTILIIFLICLVSSCSKDDELPPVTIEGMYEESQTLQYQTPDSIENFAAKFYGYLEVHPDACNHPYYGAIDNKIYDCTLGGGVYECPTGNEENVLEQKHK